MPIDPNAMRYAVVKESSMENAIRMYLSSGFTEEECVETVARQFHVGKKVTREVVREIIKEMGQNR